MTTALSVNVNKVALLRNSRQGEIPSVIALARAALDAGAQGITVHPRPDQRHIRPYDVDALAELLDSPEYADREFNIEGNPLDLSHGDHLMPLLRKVRPHQATFVPDIPGQATSDHGFDLSEATDFARSLPPLIEQMHEQGTRVSLFMDPDIQMIDRVPATGADRIELYTASYADAFEQGPEALEPVHARFHRAAEHAHQLGLGVNAGHDLSLANLPSFVQVPHLLEVSIGHALTAEALLLGMPATIRAYLEILTFPGQG